MLLSSFAVHKRYFTCFGGLRSVKRKQFMPSVVTEYILRVVVLLLQEDKYLMFFLHFSLYIL